MPDSIAKRIADYRARESMTLEELARKIGLPTATIQRWETGTRTATGLYRKRILAFLLRVGA